MTIELFGNLLGNVAVISFLFAYFMLNKGTWKAETLAYILCNLIGAILLLISLWIDWNLSAFILEAAWGLISMWGLIKYIRARKAKNA